jgi:16S rRNA (guanine966-N2)-methyltransferase
MRIVGGRWRGRPLAAPSGRDVTRPTTDRNREAIASMLLSAAGLDLSGVRVLDAFAGSGAMGLELLSRGAEHATFVERDGRTARVLASNVDACDARALCRVVRGDALALAREGRLGGGPFGIVFLDPPYAMPSADVRDLVEALAGNGALAGGALVAYERASDAPGLGLEDASCAMRARMLKHKSYGITSVDLYRMGEHDD